MRIALVSDNFYPELSGISDSIISLAKEFASRGHTVRFYVPAYSAANYAKAGMPRKEIVLGENIRIIRFFSLPYPTGTGQGRVIIPTGLRWLAIRKFRPDIIHTQLFFTAGLEALLASRILDTPIVGTNHTATREFIRYSPIRAEWFVRLALTYVNWYYGKCTLTTTPAASLAREMRDIGFKRDCRIIPNPLDTATFKPLEHAHALKKKFNFSEQTIIHAGRISHERNIDIMFRAFSLAKKALPDAELALAGAGTAENHLKKLARDLGIERSVKFLGFLDKPTLAEAYNASEIFIITSTADIQSTVMMQALAAGLPVIAARAGGTPEYVPPEVGFLVKPSDEKTFAEKIVFLLSHESERKKFSSNACVYAERFSAPEIAKRWEKIYEEAITMHNSRP